MGNSRSSLARHVTTSDDTPQPVPPQEDEGGASQDRSAEAAEETPQPLSDEPVPQSEDEAGGSPDMKTPEHRRRRRRSQATARKPAV